MRGLRECVYCGLQGDGTTDLCFTQKMATVCQAEGPTMRQWEDEDRSRHCDTCGTTRSDGRCPELDAWGECPDVVAKDDKRIREWVEEAEEFLVYAIMRPDASFVSARKKYTWELRKAKLFFSPSLAKTDRHWNSGCTLVRLKVTLES